MYLTLAILSSALIAQAAADSPPVSVNSTEDRVAGPDPVTKAAELIAATLTLPEEATVTGQPVTLLEALSSVPKDRKRFEVPHAYWRLTRAVADYRSRFDQFDQLSRIEARLDDAMLLETARASAAAELRMAKLEVVSAQHDLAEAAGLPASASLPLPSDLPLVGEYLTKFEEVRKSRRLPDRARLIDRSLPIRRQVIEGRAAAVQASQDVLQATYEAYRTGQAGFHEVLSALRRWGGQHRAFAQTVSNYNHDIADYALAVAGTELDDRVLVAMLIPTSAEPPRRPVPTRADSGRTGQPAVARQPSGVRAATFEEPLGGEGTPAKKTEPAPSQGGLRSMGRVTPTLAPPRPAAKSPEPAAETPAPALFSGQPAPVEKAAPAEEEAAPVAEEAASTGAEAAPAEAEETESRPAETPDVPSVPVPEGAESDAPEVANAPVTSEPEDAEQETPEETDRPLAPVEPAPPEETTRTVNKPPLAADDGGQAALGLYSGLLGVGPAVRPKLLAEDLHSARALPEQVGEPIQLPQCLASSSGTNRRRVIDAYWLAAERAAKYQALAAQVGFLEQLEPIAMEQRNAALGGEAMLELRAVKLAAQADLSAARLSLLDAQYQLTQQTGHSLESSWLLPATIPHSGPYKLKLEAQPKELAESWAIRRLAATIPAFSEGLQERAAAVAQADDSRAAATAAYRDGQQTMAPVLASIDHQTEETFAFLETLTQYNEAIADYALRVLPSTIGGEQLAGILVVIR